MRFVNNWTVKSWFLLAGCLSLISTTGCQWAQTSWDATRSSLGNLAWWQKDDDSPGGYHDAVRPPSSEFDPGQSRMARNSEMYGGSGGNYGRSEGYPPGGDTTGSYGPNTYKPSNQNSMNNYGSNNSSSAMNDSNYGNSGTSNSMGSGGNSGYNPYRASGNSTQNSYGGSNNTSPTPPFGGQSSGYPSSNGGYGGTPGGGYSPRSSNSNSLKVNNPHAPTTGNTTGGIQQASSTETSNNGNSIQNANYESTNFGGFEPRTPDTATGSTPPSTPPPSSFNSKTGPSSMGTPGLSSAGAPAETFAPGSTQTTIPSARTATLPNSMMNTQPPSSSIGGGGSFNPGQ